MLCLGLLLWLLMLCLLFVVGVGEAMVSNGAMVSIGGQWGNGRAMVGQW